MPPTAHRSRSWGAFLSFLWPGLGQLYAGRRRAAALQALPILALAAYLIVRAASGIEAFGVSFLDPTFALVVLVVIVLVGLWRLFSMADAYRRSSPGHGGGSWLGTLGLAVLVAVVLVSHGYAGYVAWSFYQADGQIFVGQQPGQTPLLGLQSPTPSLGGSASGGSTPTAAPTSTPAPLAQSGRVNFLLLGIDSGPGRAHALTDTMMVVSIDPRSDSAVMWSIPRDTSDFPLYSGGTFSADKLNALMEYAARDPGRYPDGPIGTIEHEIGYLVGLPINYYASLDLEGFSTMIDAVGGVDLVNPRDIVDPTDHYFLTAGEHHFNGAQALMYVRERKGLGDSDFIRAARQQQVLVALRDKLTTPAMLARIPDLLSAAAKVIRTDVPVSRLSDFVTMVKGIPASAIKQVVMGPPYEYNPPLSQTGGIYILRPYMDKIKALSITLFGADSTYHGE